MSSDNPPAIAAPEPDLQERLRAKIREELGRLIPDEVLDRYVQQAWKNLTQDNRFECAQGHPVASEGYRRERGECASEHTCRSHDAEIYTMIRGELRGALQAKITAWGAAFRASQEADAWTTAARVAGDAFFAKLRHEIVADTLALLPALLGKSCSSCGAPAVPNANCRRCGVWVAP